MERDTLSALRVTECSYSSYSVALILSFVNGGPSLAFLGTSVSGGGTQLRDVNRVEQHFRIWVMSKAGDDTPNQVRPSCQLQTAIHDIGTVCNDILFIFTLRSPWQIRQRMVCRSITHSTFLPSLVV